MDRLLITPQEAVGLAFSSTEFLREDLVSEMTIAVAQRKYLKPVLGAVYEELLAGKHILFGESYIKPALALYIRSLVIDDLGAAVGNLGLMQYKTDTAKSADAELQTRSRLKARRDGDAMMLMAVEYMESKPEEFPAYDPRENIFNRLKIAGGMVIEK